MVLCSLTRGSDQKLELDIESNPFDIINSEHMELDFTGYRPVKEHTPEYRRSLRVSIHYYFLQLMKEIYANLWKEHPLRLKQIHDTSILR